MSLAGGRATLRRALVTACLVAAPAAAQDSLPPLRAVNLARRREVRVSWPLIDFVIRADTVRGVVVYMAPSLRSAQGAQHSTVNYIDFDPVYVSQWASLAEQGIRQPWPDPKPDTPVPLAAALPSASGRSFLLLGKDPSPKAQAPFLLVYRGSVRNNGWTAYADQDQVGQLLNALGDVASLSRVAPDLVARADSGGRPLDSDELQEAPYLVAIRALRYPASERQEGRVWVQYVVSATGHVEAQSIDIILSDGPGFSDAVRQALATAIYQPGHANGAAVRVLCFQVFTFRRAG